MKNPIPVLFVALSVSAFAVSNLAVAAPQKRVAPKPAAKPSAQPAAPATVTCTVTGEKVPIADAKKLDYQGKTYYFCCPGCIAQFKKNPAKYTKSASQHHS